MKEFNLKDLKIFSSQVRRDIVRMVHAQNSGHPGGSLGCVEFFTSIFKVVMNHNIDFSMDGKNEDLFFLSNGHISPVFYSVLARTGYFPINELNTSLALKELSMGMSADYTDAIDCGATFVRIGSLIFGNRA